MNVPTGATCPRSAAVLALFLDGDAPVEIVLHGPTDDGYQFASFEALREHLEGCAACQRALRRARRLDATLAAAAGRAVGEHLTDQQDIEALASRWFEALVPEPSESRRLAPAAHHGGPRARATRLPAAVGCLVLLLCGVLWLWPAGSPSGSPGGDAAQHDREARPVARRAALGADNGRNPLQPGLGEAAAGDENEEGVGQVNAIAARPPSRSAAVHPGARLPAGIATRLYARDRATAPEPLDTSATTLATALAAAALDPGRSYAERQEGTERLLGLLHLGGAEAGPATSALVFALAAAGDRTAIERHNHRELVRRARATKVAVDAVATRLSRLTKGDRGPQLDDIALVCGAARLGDAALDAELLRLLRRRPDLAGLVPAALRCGVRDDAVAFLLACWRDQVASGRQATDPAWAEFWFVGMPESAAHALQRTLRDSRSDEERQRCLYALGIVGGQRSTSLLLAQLAAASQSQALAAAQALACLPHCQLQPLLSAAQGDDAWLLRAALARAGLPAAAHWPATAGLSRDLRCLLRAPDPGGFALAADAFRRAPPTAD